MKENYDKAPLNEEEKELLLTVYKARSRLLLAVYAIMIPLAFLTSLLTINYRSYQAGKMEQAAGTKSLAHTAWFVRWISGVTFIESILVGSGIYFYVRRTLPLKQDAHAGVKEKLPYTIVRKEYFPLTGQYYVALNDPVYLHHELSENEYQNCYEGGTVFVYRAPRSKFVFEANGRYAII